MFEGTKKKVGWFGTLKGDKFPLENLKCETSPNGPPESTNESKRSLKCKRSFDTVVGRKAHESNYCKKFEENSKPDLMKPIGAKLENLEKSLKYNKCQQKLKSVNVRNVHEA